MIFFLCITHRFYEIKNQRYIESSATFILSTPSILWLWRLVHGGVMITWRLPLINYSHYNTWRSREYVEICCMVTRNHWYCSENEVYYLDRTKRLPDNYLLHMVWMQLFVAYNIYTNKMTHIKRFMMSVINTLWSRQNGRHFANDTPKFIFMNENVWI